MSQQGADLIGRTLGRTYQIERLLGGGGMGAVYAARHVRTGGLFALKILHRETAADTDIYKRFQDEARTVSALRHPHIVQVTDFDRDDDGTPFIVMELLEGEDLYQRLCRVGKLSVEQVLDIGRQVGSALHAAHEKGVIHRDIKPQNIFLVRHELADQVTEVAKVVDFGISKIRRTGQQMTRDMTILGTPQFMSPEAALGQNSQLDGRADQWSLAVIMYLSLTGRLPFDGENLVGVLYMVVHEQPVRIKQLAPEVPDTLIAAIERAMSKKKEDRYPRMVDFVRGMSGLGVTSGGSIRLGPGGAQSAVIRSLPQELGNRPAQPAAPVSSPQMAAEAPTAVPHLGTTPAPPRLPTPPQQGSSPAPQPRVATPPAQPTQLQSEAPTKATHLAPGAAGAAELPPTRPVVSPADKATALVSGPPVQSPEMVATPSSPTAFSPLAGLSTGTPVRPPPASGNTPTNIALTEGELQSLMSGSETTPSPEPIEDLQGAPTRVGVMPQPESPTVARYEMPTNATVPLTVVSRPQGLDAAFDAAYPSTLSHATGQEVSLRPRLFPPWATVRETVLRVVGVVPRSSVRLAVTGGLLTLLLLLTVVWLASGSTSPPEGKGSGVALGASTGGASTGLVADGGAGTGTGSKDASKSAAPGHEPVTPDDKNAAKGKGGKATKKPGPSKASSDPKKRA